MTFEKRAIQILAVDLAAVPEDCWRFFTTLFAVPPMRSVKMVAKELAVHPSMLSSRFARAGLPSPKVYLDRIFLVRLAGAYEHWSPISFTQLVNDFDERSIPQSVSRSIKRLTGVTPAAWLASLAPEYELLVFRRRMIVPYLTTLRGFHPLIEEGT